MPTSTDQPNYPYARLKAMSEIMDFIRNPKWRPEKIDVNLIKMLNIASSKESTVVAALRFLGLINRNGEPTDLFDELKNNYQDTLHSIIEEKYSDIFSMIPKDMIDQPRIVNFFMNQAKTTRDTAEYQGMLFGWLCRESGIQLPKLPPNFKRARFGNVKKENK